MWEERKQGRGGQGKAVGEVSPWGSDYQIKQEMLHQQYFNMEVKALLAGKKPNRLFLIGERPMLSKESIRIQMWLDAEFQIPEKIAILVDTLLQATYRKHKKTCINTLDCNSACTAEIKCKVNRSSAC